MDELIQALLVVSLIFYEECERERESEREKKDL